MKRFADIDITSFLRKRGEWFSLSTITALTMSIVQSCESSRGGAHCLKAPI
jgi:hypothetical protein